MPLYIRIVLFLLLVVQGLESNPGPRRGENNATRSREAERRKTSKSVTHDTDQNVFEKDNATEIHEQACSQAPQKNEPKQG